MNILKALTFVLLLTVILPDAHAGLTRQELRNRQDAHLAWTVDAPIEQVFSAYKEYSEVHLTPPRVLWAPGGETIAEIKDGKAEITMLLKSNPFGQGMWFLVELTAQEDKTHVDYWYANRTWRKKSKDFMGLLPSTPVTP